MSCLRQIIAAIEPWYDWGAWGGTSIETERSGDGRYFQIEWLRFQIFIAFTRFPKEK
ncbi:hypothetical protein [Sphingobium yanoikuyae]|uniref:hypothetical protein n=1 Tax=Sphingobium yanoikuyae TaxID=13690 RepID=UPI000A810ACF|nr:hypothetical protein [Sphingobium yanoikuyae]